LSSSGKSDAGRKKTNGAGFGNSVSFHPAVEAPIFDQYVEFISGRKTSQPLFAFYLLNKREAIFTMLLSVTPARTIGNVGRSPKAALSFFPPGPDADISIVDEIDSEHGVDDAQIKPSMNSGWV
jgi:hypothetical protein